MLPDNRTPGEIEDFVVTMIPQGDPVWPRAVQYIDGIPTRDRSFNLNKATKAKLHAWLATRRQPGRMGTAIGAGDLLASGPLATTFVGWLKALFA